MNDEATNEVSSDELNDIVHQLIDDDNVRIAHNAHRKEIYDEAKSRGFDTKALRAIVRIARADKEKLAYEETILQIYRDKVNL